MSEPTWTLDGNAVEGTSPLGATWTVRKFELDDVANVEQRATQDGRSLVMMLAPKPSAKKETKSAGDESPLKEKEA